MKRLVAHALAIAIGACAGIAAAQLNGGVMESQRQGTVAITSGAINGTTIGATTPSTGAFTTLSATGAVALSPASANVVVSPTGTGVVTVNPATAGTMNNVAIGGSTPLAGTFTTLTSSSTFTNSGTGPHAFGSTRSDSFIALNNTFSGTSNAYGILGVQNITVPANGNGFSLYLAPTLNKAGSGTHPDFATLFLDAPAIGAGAATLTNATTLKIGGAPSVGTNQRAFWVASGTTLLDGQMIAKGTATNDSAAAGYIGELLTTTVASGSAVSLTTATSANIATVSLTAGDWDCSAQVTHNAAATTSVTLLQIGISATTATLPTQAGGSGIGTDPLAIWRQAAAVPGGALTTNVGPVRVTLSGTTNIFLVANDTFTVSTMTGYGTIRCRRMR